MPSAKFLQIASRIARENKPLFDSLLEYERTGKVRTKDRMTFTIDKAVAARFKKYCRRHGYSMSAKVEEAMRQTLGRD